MVDVVYVNVDDAIANQDTSLDNGLNDMPTEECIGPDFRKHLIDEVQRHAEIWNSSIPGELRNKNTVAQAWHNIASKLGHTDTFCKSAWQRCKDDYKKALKRLERRTTPSGAVIKAEPSWEYSKLMEFYKPFMVFAPPGRNMNVMRRSMSITNQQGPDQKRMRPTFRSVDRLDKEDLSLQVMKEERIKLKLEQEKLQLEIEKIKMEKECLQMNQEKLHYDLVMKRAEYRSFCSQQGC